VSQTTETLSLTSTYYVTTTISQCFGPIPSTCSEDKVYYEGECVPVHPPPSYGAGVTGYYSSGSTT